MIYPEETNKPIATEEQLPEDRKPPDPKGDSDNFSVIVPHKYDYNLGYTTMFMMFFQSHHKRGVLERN